MDEEPISLGYTTQVYKSILATVGELLKCICCPFLCCQGGPIINVDQGFVGVLTEFGVFKRVLQPGMYAYNLASQTVQIVSMKMQVIEIPQQAAMTHDNLSVKVDAVTYVTVVDPKRAIFEVDNYPNAVRILAASTLLRVIAEHELQQIFTDRATLNSRLTSTMQEKTANWGLQVTSVELRDINIPETMQRAMAQIAEATREADAKVVVATGQQKAASIFAEAAATMEENPLSLQLQWFETLRQISNEKKSTVIVPDSVVGPLSSLTKRSGAKSSGDATSVDE